MKAAAVYARAGWRIVPLHDVSTGACSCGKPACPSAGKHPRIAEWQNAATADAATVAAWIARYPAGNVGVATGGLFFALDVDPDKGGAETLAALEQIHGTLPRTVTARTGSGGTHYLFQHVPGFSNTAGKLGRGLDTRADGGQIVVAPSVSLKGAYRWINAPWSTKIAPAPQWLIDALTAAPAAPSTLGTTSTERGYFPAASPEVLDAAAAALVRHGPAVQGNGGDAHTFVAAAMLTHDFALTPAEAWPLLLEWNDTCQPPWDEQALAEKLSGSGKYATRAYGCRRDLDALETGLKLIADWRAKPEETARHPLIERCREIAKRIRDVSKRAVLEYELSDASGLKVPQLGLPKPTPDLTPKPGQIIVTTKLHEVADEAILAMVPHVFQRVGVLVEVVKTPATTFIHDLETHRIRDVMSRSAEWVRPDDKGLIAQVPPLDVASMLHARRDHPKVRVLEAVTTAPVFLADGSILSERGYNEQARLFLEPSVQVDVPDEPTRDDARAAVVMLHDLVGDFLFLEPADFSSWLAGLLSPLVKSATGNAPAPLICVNACSPGAGKTLLTNLIARIITGNVAEIRPYNPKDPGEWGKRLTAFVKAASPVSVFDNANGPIGDEGLDRLVTTSSWSDRILGASEAPPLPNVTTWFATGNNIEPQGDTVRRSLMVRIDVLDESPQTRSGFAHAELELYTIENRGALLSAALTLLRAYHVAGRPSQRLASWGSFTTWSELVRGAIVWTGCADPFLTQRRASADLNEPENTAHDFWIGVIDGTDGLASSVSAAANAARAMDVLGLREGITPYTLRKFVARFVDKPRAGQRIRRDRDGTGRFFVERIG